MAVLVWKITAVQVLALAGFGLVMGIWLKRIFPALDRLNIPASVIGGLVYALAAMLLRGRYLNLEMDLVLRDILMVAFFTTVGMSASLRLLKFGGKQVVWFLGVAVAGVLLQNILGIAVAKALGLNPLIGLLAGSVALTGGPATALAFGATFEKMGVESATVIGIAAAIFGIVSGGLLGGYVGGSLVSAKDRTVVRNKPGAGLAGAEVTAYAADPHEEHVSRMSDESVIEQSSLLNNIIVLVLAMGLGTVVSRWLEQAGMVLPSYIGAMICAGLIRNVDDATGLFRISQHRMDEMGSISLDLFIVMALLTLRLWELVNLAAPVLVILVLQILLVLFLCRFLVYRVMGRDYEAAVMSAGYCGFMLGTTANSLACMGEVVIKFGAAPRSFFVVSIVGAFLIDFINALVITQTATMLR
ncbi:MAG: sodium/glutamate symporter [Acidobacteriia bacterium]|nr:sodium/glutamate symporter [Terriglobia bacterium]